MTHMCVMVVKPKVRHECVMARDDPHFRLRVPPDLKAQIEAAARANGQSINAEIVRRLAESFRPEADEETDIDDLVAQYDRLGVLLDAAVRKLQSEPPPPGPSARPLKRRD